MPDTVDAFLLQHITTRLVTEFPTQVEKCLEVLSEDDLWWRPHEQSNAVGNLVLHVAGIESPLSRARDRWRAGRSRS